MAELELDHGLIFAPSTPALEEALRKRGFAVGFGRDHPGQGTRNRLLLFRENYLEFLELRSRPEAEGNALRLDRRMDWAQNPPVCPFGVGFRGTLGEGDEASFFDHRPEYGGEDLVIRIHREHRGAGRLPLLFTSSGGQDSVGRAPADWAGVDPRLFDHGNGATRICRVVIRGPGLEAWPLATPASWIDFRSGERFHLTVFVDGEEFEPLRGGILWTLAPFLCERQDPVHHGELEG